MNDLTTTTTGPDVPITLEVRIDYRRAQLLWHNATSVAGFDLVDRFEIIEANGSFDLQDAGGWTSGTVMWCEGALEAITLASYEKSNGFASHLLWDVSWPELSGGYVVLTSRPFGC